MRRLCEHAFLTSQGSPYGRFQRALKAGLVHQAETAARELGRIDLADALRLVELYAAAAPEKFDRAAVRWIDRYLCEREPTLLRASIALAALSELRGPGEQASRVLHELVGTAAKPAPSTASGFSDGAA